MITSPHPDNPPGRLDPAGPPTMPALGTVLTLPAKHACDWYGRYDGDDVREAVHTARTVTLVLGDAALRDLIADAHYYADEMGPSNTGDLDYRPAARALIRAFTRLRVGYVFRDRSCAVLAVDTTRCNHRPIEAP